MAREILKADREKQLQYLEKKGIDPYPGVPPERTHTNEGVVNRFGHLKDQEVKVVGRMTAVREHGKLVFFDVEDETGKLQGKITKEGVGEDGFETFKRGFAPGDFVSISGKVTKSKTGEITVEAQTVGMLAKALLPTPVKLEDPETKSRQRYLDMLVNPEVRERFKLRSNLVEHMRQTFRGFEAWEVETPVLDTTYGGASARPFVTHHNALGEDLYLRISNELYLKRLVTGGFEGVFEFSRDFRNEGMDKDHNPEFTIVELYVAYRDYEWMMNMSENLISSFAEKQLGTTKINYQGQEIDLSTPWKRLTIHDGVEGAIGVDPDTLSDEEIRKIAAENGIYGEEDRGYLLVELFDKLVTPTLINPTFVIDYPESTSPLTKKHRAKKGLVERFECVVAGMEVMNCYTELNDPRKQRENFEAELKRAAAGDEEAMPMDDDFIVSMEYGMPPMGGIGISIDRWTMLFTDTSHIRDVIAFPTMKRKKPNQK